MPRGRVSAALFCLAAASSSATADEMSAAEPPHYLLFSGFDLWSGGSFLHGGLLWSPESLDREGFTLKVLLGAGNYAYRSGALGGIGVTGHEMLGAAMPGWRFKPSWGEITVFAGVDVQDHRLTPDDASGRLRGSYLGARFGFDLWAEPMPGMMAQVGGSLSTIGTGYWARAAVGWRVLDQLFVGPELIALGDTTYRQWRAGAHLTGWRFGAFEWSAGAGYAYDSDARSGAYVRFGVLARR